MTTATTSLIALHHATLHTTLRTTLHTTLHCTTHPGLSFTYGVMGSRPSFCRHCKKFLTSAIIKWWFSTSRGLRKMIKWYCYKMNIGFYHEITWRGSSTTTKWWFVFIIKLFEGDIPSLQNEDLFSYVFIIRLLEENTSTLQNISLTCFDMLLSEGLLALLQNEIGFLYVVFPWANSLATKWLSILKGLSSTETLKTYRMQFPSCGYKMPGPTPYWHLDLIPEMPLIRGTGLPIL